MTFCFSEKQKKLLEVLVAMAIAGTLFVVLDPQATSFLPTLVTSHFRARDIAPAVPELDPSVFTFEAAAPFGAAKATLNDDESEFEEIDDQPSKKRLFRVAQNCTTGAGGLTNVTYVNSATGQISWYLANNTQACSGNTGGTSTGTTGGETTNTQQTGNAFPFTSTNLYHVTTNLDCAIGPTRALETFASISGLSPSQLILSSYQCGSIALVFSCASAVSAADADATCSQLTTAACQPGTNLYAAVGGTNCGVQSNGGGSSSNTALYALFALMAIPILLLIALFLYLRYRRHKAVEQYMQDAATYDHLAPLPPLMIVRRDPINVMTPVNTPSGGAVGAPIGYYYV